jgi:hypothetical protein
MNLIPLFLILALLTPGFVYNHDNALKSARWIQYGYLWTGGVFSEPITIRFNNTQYFGHCE